MLFLQHNLFNREVLLQRILPIVVFAVLCFSCSEPAGEKKNFQPGKEINLSEVTFIEGKPGGTLYAAVSSDPKTFNLVMAHETSSTDAVGELFEGLTKINLKTLKPEGALAERWECSEDGRVWIFFLRRGVKWFDGKPFTADDVVFTYRKIYFNPEIPNSTKDMFLIDGKLPEVNKINDYTVQFVLPAPFAPLLYSLQSPVFPKHILMKYVEKGTFTKTWTISTPPEKLVGTGPYKLTRYIPGQYLEYERNPYYYLRDDSGTKLPYIRKKVKFILPDQNTQLLKFKSGQIDFYSIRGDDYPELKKSEKSANFTIYNLGQSLSADFLCFNQRPESIPSWKLKLFRDVRFRRAISHAIDRKGIILTVYNGLGYPAYGPVTPANKLYYDPDIPKFPYNLKKAKQLLRELGLKDINNDGWLETPEGHKVEFNLLTNSNNPSRVQIGSIIKHDLKLLGIDVHFQPLDFNNLVEKLLHTHDFDAVIIGLTSSMDPNGGRNVWMSSGQLHMWNPCQKTPQTRWEKEIDRLFEKGVKEMDFKKRVEIYKKAYRIIAEQLPLIYIASPIVLEAARNRVKNYYPTVWGTYRPERMFLTE